MMLQSSRAVVAGRARAPAMAARPAAGRPRRACIVAFKEGEREAERAKFQRDVKEDKDDVGGGVGRGWGERLGGQASRLMRGVMPTTRARVMPPMPRRLPPRPLRSCSRTCRARRPSRTPPASTKPPGTSPSCPSASWAASRCGMLPNVTACHHHATMQRRTTTPTRHAPPPCPHGCLAALQAARIDAYRAPGTWLLPAFTRRREVFAGRLAMLGALAGAAAACAWCLTRSRSRPHTRACCTPSRPQPPRC